MSSLLHGALGLHGLTAYVVVGALCFGEASFFLGFVLPGETAVVLGGVLASFQHVGLLPMMAVVVICAVAGDSVGYEVGRHFGPALVRRLPARARRGAEESQAFLQRRGGPAVFIGRFTALFRALIPGVAGMSGLRYRTFLFWNALGGLLWGIGFTLAGYFAGQSYRARDLDRRQGLDGNHRFHRARDRGLPGLAEGPGAPQDDPGGPSRAARSGFFGADRLTRRRGMPTNVIAKRRRYLQPAGADRTQPNRRYEMALQLGDVAPDFTAETTEGTINFYDWLGDGWGILFSHPKDFTPVCTTELGEVSRLKGDFEKRNAKVMGLSVDPLESHERWVGDIADATGHSLNFPLIADSDRKVADLYGMIHPNANDTMTVRSVFIVGPDKKLKLTITYPASTGRNFEEILRVLDSLQLTAKYSVATPVNWHDGEDVIIVPAVSDEDAKEKFPKGFKAVKPYLRYTPQPNR